MLRRRGGLQHHRRGWASALLGLAAGLFLGLLFFGGARTNGPPTSSPPPPPPSLPRTTRAAAAAAAAATITTTTAAARSSARNASGGLLFVGVMTAKKYLDTRARAVYESWGREVPGAVGFYSSEDSGAHFNGSRPPFPLHPLPRVDDSYPPQKKSFLMLQHMWLNYGERYEWFLRADDDLYVRTDRLESLLRSVDSRRPGYIGQAGRGNSEEFGLLSLEYDENFCMGGPGVLLSRETLRRIVPHVKYCLANLYTSHEDVELGRCVRKFAGISCTWNYEMQSILYHNSSGDLAFTGKLKSKEVHRAISMHPVKSPPHMYRLHNYMKGIKIQELQNKRLELQRDIRRMATELQVLAEKKSRKRVGSGGPKRRGSWDFISRSEYSLADSNPRRRIHGDLREGLEDVVREVMSTINACSRQRGRLVEERQALYGYRRRTPEGVDTVLDLLLIYKKYRGKKITLPVRRHLYLHQPFTGLETREVDGHGQATVHLVVPVMGRREALRRFLDNYRRVCLDEGCGPTRLIIVAYPEDDSDEGYARVTELVTKLNSKGDEGVRVVRGTGTFSRARALDQGASLLRDDDLVFFVDVDIDFGAPAIDRIRSNALRGQRLYFPVVFSQYDPTVVLRDREHRVVDGVGGFWRLFGFGIAAMYKGDYLGIGGYDTAIEGWGKEDVDLFEKAVRSPSLRIFRAPDPDIVHVYHGVNCDKLKSSSPTDDNSRQQQLAMCKGTRADTYASTQQLAAIIYRDPGRYLNFSASNRRGTAVKPRD